MMCKTKMIDCPECGGDGTVEYEVAVPMSFSNPIGFLDTEIVGCENCDGSGQIEADWEDK
jgi:DnaJ-class molecular chaperone